MKVPKTPFMATLAAKVVEIFEITDGFEKLKVTVEASRYPEVAVEIQKMYEYVPCSIKKLMALAELVGTDDIVVNQWSSPGCPTCDYGSSYVHEFRFTVPEDRR